MSSSRRPAKRSILGLRVAAKRELGFYEAATVLEVSSKPSPDSPPGNSNSSDKFLLKFDDGTSNWYTERQVIGQGFQPISSACLLVGQLIYCTVGHRETPGRIIHLPLPTSELFGLALEDGTGQTIKRKQEDMRLIKSRKSARITADKDYHSLALGKVDLYGDMDTTPPPPPRETHFFSASSSRKRAIPMDLPAPLPVNNCLFIPPGPYSPHSEEEELRYSPDAESDESLEGEEEADEEENREQGDVLMDECSAALVLMSLGASPHSKAFDFHDDAGFSSASNSSGYASSWPRGIGLHSPSTLIDSASTTGSSDEGIEVASNQVDPCHLDHDYASWTEQPVKLNVQQPPRKRRPSNSIVFQCTWPQCQHMETTRTGVKRHIQNTHFTSMGQTAEDLEFYYNEVEVAGSLELPSPSTPLTEKSIAASSVPSTSRGWSKENSFCPSERSSFPMTRRHRSSLSQSSETTSNSSRLSRFSSIAKPINIPRSSKRRDWDSASAPQSDALSISSSVGSSGIAQLQREVKKCRKVYGMDNREMWCTQCKWKKACTRFAE